MLTPGAAQVSPAAGPGVPESASVAGVAADPAYSARVKGVETLANLFGLGKKL